MRQLQGYLIIAITFLFSALLPHSILARHLVGGEMTYTCLGNGDYEIQLLVYRDCLGGGGNFDPEASIAIYQCGATIDCNLLRQGSQGLVFTAPLGAVTLENQPDATCLLPQVCIEQGVYKFRLSDYDFFLPQVNNSYHVVYQRCCRNETITNIISPNETGNTYTVEITPDAQIACNTSPQFNKFPPAIVCTNQSFSFEHTANDKEGDSLVYVFTAPLLGGGLDLSGDGRITCSGITPSPPCPPPYNQVSFVGGNVDGTRPFGNNLQIDSSTGIISGTPTIQGHYVAGISVSEYRNGVLLSTTQREFQITIANCEQLNERTGSICDDNNPNTENDLIQFDCSCKGTVKESVLNTPDLLFSEYVEGDGDNKCLEIYNPLDIAVDLSEYEIKVFTNGSQNGQLLKSLMGNLAPKSIYTICKSSADQILLNVADATFDGDYDGNDALSLEKNNILVDLFGNIGCDPGTAWTSTSGRTQNQTLLRCPCVQTGVKANPSNCDFPTLDTEWISLPNGNYVNFGQSTSEQQNDPTIQFLTNLLCDCQPICKARDSLALVDLYNATNGPQWTTTWDLTQPIAQWFGVEINEDGCVTCLDLDGIADCNNNPEATSTGNNLQGTLPLSIGDLKDLTSLYLNNNLLTNQFPSTIGYLLNLIALDISNNQLSGPIPPALGNLNQLEFLWLNNNSLSDSIPPDMGLLQNLKILNAENNTLTNSIPEGIGTLQNLVSLNFSNNQLSGCYPASLLNHCDIDSDFSNNPQLPWEGDFATFCLSENQESAPCDDDDLETMDDRIQTDCTCLGKLSQEEEEEEEEEENNVDNVDENEDKDEDEDGEFEEENNVDENEDEDGEFEDGEIEEEIDTIDAPIIPNAITPNGDALNEFLFFWHLETPEAYPDNELIIFNRWGDIIYQAMPYNNDWNGINNRGDKLPEGTYYYILRLDLSEGVVLRGMVTILR